MRTPLTFRTVRATVAASVLLLALGACSGEPGTTVAPQTAQTRPSAGASAGEATSPDAEPAEKQDPSAAGTWNEQTLLPAMMAAVEDQDSVHVAMTTTAAGQSFEAHGDLAFHGDRQDLALTMAGASFGTGTVEVRLVDRVLYLAVPPMTPQGKFIEVRPGDTGSPFAGMLDQMKAVDPRESFVAFEAGLREVRYLGDERVAGEKLEHYQLTVDFRAAAKAQGLPPAAGMPRTVDYDTWLDDDALMRRIELHMMQQVSTVMEMSAWGEPVTIEAPAPKDLVEPPRR